MFHISCILVYNKSETVQKCIQFCLDKTIKATEFFSGFVAAVGDFEFCGAYLMSVLHMR